MTVNTRVKTPKKIGGTLIRRVVSLMKDHPKDSHILCGVSGGADSIALAHLLIHYGKKIFHQGGLSLVHINHGWRSAESDADEAFVLELAQHWGVECEVVRLKRSEQFIKGQSPEELARSKRKEVFEKLAKKKNAVVLTAHHADDLAETQLWKILTGSPQKEWGGIRFQSGIELRPFLTTSKKEIMEYLKEEGLTYRDDSSNHDPRFLRARMRQDLIPVLDSIFPKWRLNLSRLTDGTSDTITDEGIKGLIQAAGLRLRGNHWKELIRQGKTAENARIDLPKGYKLTHNKREGVWILKQTSKEQK